jgi:YD repeat-containing protein
MYRTVALRLLKEMAENKNQKQQNIMKKYIVFSLLFIQYMAGQELPPIVPLSPEASSLFKFMEVPVSLYAGTQNTTIPLIEISSGGVNIPITLSYSSRGVQVSETASRVGIGWTLNYGGMISRQIRGSADENSFGYNSNPVGMPIFYSNSTTRLNYIEDEAIYQSQHDIFAQTDYYPDKFMLNSNFYSGEFFIDKNDSNIVTQKYSDIKIYSHTGNMGYESFSVVDNCGNSYLFGGKVGDSYYVNEYDFIERAVNVPMGHAVFFADNPNSHISYNTFNLREIKTPNNRKIEYQYEDETVQIVRRTGDKENSYSASYQVGDPIVTCTYNACQSHQKVLKEIKFDNGRVEFIKSSEERQDLDDGHALDMIELYNVKDQLVKRIKFNYIYKEGFEDNNVNYSLQNADTRATKRLFLQSIEFKDIDLNTDQKYVFEYDDQPLPSKHSNSIDLWGYYNGKNRGQFLRFDDYGGNCSVNPTKMQAGILKKITYPTGGSSVFEYEPNLLQNDLASAIEISNPNVIENHIITISQFDEQFFDGHQYVKTFTVSNCLNNRAMSIIHLPIGQGFTCKLFDLTNGGYTTLISGVHTNVPIGNGTYKLIFDPGDPNWDPGILTEPNLDVIDEDILFSNSFCISISYITSEFDYKNTIYGPGNRIKSITHFSAEGIEEYTRKYEYKTDSNSLSGYLLSVSNFKVHRPNSPENSGLYDHTPNFSGGLFNSFSSDTFGYTQVNEYLIDKLNNINEKISHFYSLIPDFESYYKFPLHPITNHDWLRGKELLTRYYKKESNSFKLIREIENNYLLYNSIIINYPTYPITHVPEDYFPYGFVEMENSIETNIEHPYRRRKTDFCIPYSTGCPLYPASNFNNIVALSTTGYRTSFFTGGTFDLHSTKTTDYIDDEKYVENLTTYEYDYDHHYNVAKTLTKNSMDETKETRYFYASSPEMETEPNVQGLIDNNIVGIPLDTQTYKINDKLSEQKTIYKSLSNMLLPDYVQTSKGNSDLETRIHYTKYDELGNPIEVQTENGMKICYIWGYNKTQPLAKIENISYVDIPENLVTDLQNATTITETNSGAPEDVIIGYQKALRNSPALANAMVTTYTYNLLVGVTSITDPRGYLTRYEYDTFGRLETVYDAAGNRLSNNQYHYRTQD